MPASLSIGEQQVHALSWPQAITEKGLLFLGDFLAVWLAFFLSVDLRQFAQLAALPPHLTAWMGHAIGSHFVCYLATSPILVYRCWEGGHYSRRFPFWEENRQLMRALFTGTVVEAALLTMLSAVAINRTLFFSTWAFVFALIPLMRMGVKRTLMAFGAWWRPTILVGNGENAKWAYKALKDERLMGYRIQWFGSLDDDRAPSGGQWGIGESRLPVVALGTNPESALDQLGRPQVVVALDSLRGQEQLIHRLVHGYKDVFVVPSLRGLPLYGMEVSHFLSHEVLMLRVRNNLGRGGMLLIKRLFDFIVASVLLILFSWFFVFLIVRIRQSGGPAIYSHQRVGQGGKKFSCYKFRTMVPDADKVLKDFFARDPQAAVEWQRDFKLRNDPRVTKIGAFLRRTSLDELPQLWNVIKGEMSLVGPRPIVEEELCRYGDQLEYYLEAKPGMTGLWQVSGRNDTGYEQRVGLDTWYTRNWSLWYDIVILLKTVKVVLNRTGAY